MKQHWLCKPHHYVISGSPNGPISTQQAFLPPPSCTKQSPLLLQAWWWWWRRRRSDIIKTHWERMAVNATFPPPRSVLMIRNIFLWSDGGSVAAHHANDFWLWLRRNWRGGGGGGSSHRGMWLESDGCLIYFSHLPLSFHPLISVVSFFLLDPLGKPAGLYNCAIRWGF